MDNMPSEDERKESGLVSSVTEEQKKIAARLGKSACDDGLIDPGNINKGYCMIEETFCNTARLCHARNEYHKKQGCGHKY